MRSLTGWKQRSETGLNAASHEEIWQGEAESDLDRIADFILKDDAAAALRLVCTIREATRVPGEHPNIERTGRVAGTRELAISELPYTLPYQITDQEIRILAVSTHRGNGRIISVKNRPHSLLVPVRMPSSAPNAIDFHREDAVRSAAEDVRTAGHEVAHVKWS